MMTYSQALIAHIKHRPGCSKTDALKQVFTARDRADGRFVLDNLIRIGDVRCEHEGRGTRLFVAEPVVTAPDLDTDTRSFA